jgi:hypothetical protein
MKTLEHFAWGCQIVQGNKGEPTPRLAAVFRPDWASILLGHKVRLD